MCARLLNLGSILKEFTAVAIQIEKEGVKVEVKKLHLILYHRNYLSCLPKIMTLKKPLPHLHLEDIEVIYHYSMHLNSPKRGYQE